MQMFNVVLTRTTTETAVIDIQANSLEEAREQALDRYHEGEFDDDFMHGDSDVTTGETEAEAQRELIATLTDALEQARDELEVWAETAPDDESTAEALEAVNEAIQQAENAD